MRGKRIGQTAVIFLSQRTEQDDPGYRAAAAAMVALAAEQPGYCGISSVRDTDGLGITISYWADEASARGWRDHPEHRRIREAGRGLWYQHYTVEVATITRDYSWTR
jgi:heme-degrading monooxygenase HmoA